MDIQQLNAIGEAIAQTVKSKWDFDDISFRAGGGYTRNQRPWAFCFFRVRGLNSRHYCIPEDLVEWLLAMPDEQAIGVLRLMIEGRVRRILDEDGNQRSDEPGQGGS
jgi:hypothetical protein